MKVFSRWFCVPVSFALALCGLVVATPAADAAKANAKDAFVTSIVKPAQSAQRETGVPASFLIAQAIDSSNFGTSTPAKKAKNPFNNRCTATVDAKGFASLALKQVGKPYVLGAEAAASNPNPAKFDCSELVEWLFARSGTVITDLAASQYNVTKAVAKGSAPKVGDLVFLRNNPARSNGIGHVAVLTKKLSNGDWQIVEAKGRAYGVVKTTLSYWKTRKYYAGLRRYSKLVFAGQQGTLLGARSSYQSSCLAVTTDGKTIRYRSYSSLTNAFLDQAKSIAGDSGLSTAMSFGSAPNSFVDAYAKAEKGAGAAAYATRIKKLISQYKLTEHDVVPFSIVLLQGRKGVKVKALQQLLRAEKATLGVTSSYDAATVKAVKAYQKKQKLEADGEAGPKTLGALFATIGSGAKGARVDALHSLLASQGYAYSGSSTFGTATVASVKAFQQAAGLPTSGTVTKNTWIKLYMSVEPAKTPVVTGTLALGATVKVDHGTWGPSSVKYRYQWYRGTTAIAGATASSYTLTAADTGTTVKVAVTGWRAAYTSVVRTSPSSAVVPKATITTAPVPTLTGEAKVAKTLTAATKAWGPGNVALSYQWFRGATPITGATKASYQLVGDDDGTAISVAVTGTQAGYTTRTQRSKATAKVSKAPLTATPVPAISGAAKVGATLTATAGAWTPTPVVVGFQWYRGTTPVKGATTNRYTLTAADLGQLITVRTTGSRLGYVSTTTRSKATTKVAAGTLKGTTPTVSGSAAVGRTLTAKPGTWTPGQVSISYQWYRGSTAIKGATKASLILSAADRGHLISVTVKGTQAGYAGLSLRSAATKAVASGTLTAGKATISGSATVGKKLTTKPGTWKPAPVTLRYQWYRDGKAIAGATKASRTLTKADKGHKVSVKVTGSKSGYSAASASVSVTVK